VEGWGRGDGENGQPMILLFEGYEKKISLTCLNQPLARHLRSLYFENPAGRSKFPFS
jgi:hypothetical protein